jgi:hypothetical protein
VRGFVERKPVWLVRPLGLKAVQKTAESMEVETRRFYEAATAAPPTPAPGNYSATSPRKNGNTRTPPKKSRYPS